ncbi:hypothetical protein DER45DRAFT_558068 [Fusarium avenaceum]|nr:hypothetical protein DER45DRAFT_558068 [Fusarium avenaceum]
MRTRMRTRMRPLLVMAMMPASLSKLTSHLLSSSTIPRILRPWQLIMGIWWTGWRCISFYFLWAGDHLSMFSAVGS